MERQQQIISWLGALYPGLAFTLAPASADASFRRYFRVSFTAGDAGRKSLIVMDAPPQQEDCRPWLAVQRLFQDAGAHVPEVLAVDLDRGFLLLSDLGHTTYLDALKTASPAQASALYEAAWAALIQIQLSSRPGALPEYDHALLQRELSLFPDWYVAKHLDVTLSTDQRAVMEQVLAQIVAINLGEARVFVHRDYHSRNLMQIEPGKGASPGIIDFQDAVYGPISYDLVSLFKDAYVAREEELSLDWLIRYWEKARAAGLPVRADFADFFRDYEWMGVQRHLKVLGIFARLYHRDGKQGYLKDMPLVADYLRKTCERYRELGPLAKLLDELENRAAKVGYTF